MLESSSSPCLLMPELRKKWPSTVVLHHSLSPRTLFAGGIRVRWCFLWFPSWPKDTCVFLAPVSLQRESFLRHSNRHSLFYGYSNSTEEHTCIRTCRPASVLTQELAHLAKHICTATHLHYFNFHCGLFCYCKMFIFYFLKDYILHYFMLEIQNMLNFVIICYCYVC